MAAGRQLLKTQGRKPANCKERRAPTGITTSNGSPPGELNLPESLATSYSEPSTVTRREKSRRATGPAQPTARGPAVSPQRTAAAHKVGTAWGPQLSLKAAPTYCILLPQGNCYHSTSKGNHHYPRPTESRTVQISKRPLRSKQANRQGSTVHTTEFSPGNKNPLPDTQIPNLKVSLQNTALQNLNLC